MQTRFVLRHKKMFSVHTLQIQDAIAEMECSCKLSELSDIPSFKPNSTIQDPQDEFRSIQESSLTEKEEKQMLDEDIDQKNDCPHEMTRYYKHDAAMIKINFEEHTDLFIRPTTNGYDNQEVNISEDGVITLAEDARLLNKWKKRKAYERRM